MGRRKSDLVLDGCSLVSVYTGEIVPDTQVAVVNGRIAYVGSDASHTIGSKTKTIHLGGKYLVPGFADPHTHIDQFVMPQYLAEKSLLHGTTTLFADSIDITSVAGYVGIFCGFQKMTKYALRFIFHKIHRTSSRSIIQLCKLWHLQLFQERLCTRNYDTVGLGEVFSWTKVTNKRSQHEA